MDPLSQAVLGGVAAQLKAKPNTLKAAAIMGVISGMAADLDVLIRSSSDPLLAIEYHRHFSHSLIFIPIGGLLCALLLHFLFAKRWQLSFKQSYIWCTLGYASHGLLDACTSYGTRLLWPFSDARIAWDTISIIDPILTLPLLALLVLSALKQQAKFHRLALVWLSVYMSLGWIQQDRALNIGQQLAQSRGHNVDRITVKPSFGNLAVWKLIYETDGHYYIDAVKPGFAEPIIWPGDTIKKLDPAKDLPWLKPTSQQAIDIQRFSDFSSGYIALDPSVKNRVIDMRYSMLPNEVEALWGIDLNPDAEASEHVQWVALTADRDSALGTLWAMLWK